MKLARGFSRQHRIIHFTTIGSASGLTLHERRIYLSLGLHPYPGTTTARAGLPSCVTPSLTYYHLGSAAPPLPSTPKRSGRLHGLSINGLSTGRFKAGTGISTGCPSTTPVGLALGPDLPWADQLDPGTLSQSAHTFPTCVSLLMPAFSLVNRPQLASAAASPGTRRSPTHHSGRWPYCCNDTTSAVRLSPATLSARNHLTSELLRTLSRVAASKPTSWLSGRTHILSHLAHA